MANNAPPSPRKRSWYCLGTFAVRGFEGAIGGFKVSMAIGFFCQDKEKCEKQRICFNKNTETAKDAEENTPEVKEGIFLFYLSATSASSAVSVLFQFSRSRICYK